MIIPPSITPTDRVAIICPAGRARITDVEAAAEVLRIRGFRPEISPMVYENYGSFSGTLERRTEDFMRVWTDDSIRAVICARGGYGAVQMLDRIDGATLRRNAKWLVGFSDICALHTLMWRNGIASVHGPMAKHISADGGSNPYIDALTDILCGTPRPLCFAPDPLNRPGKVTAPLTGGNLSVLTALCGTPFGMIRPGTILFIEDIAEPVYKVQRMLWQLRLAGTLQSLAGLVVGTFTDWNPDINHVSMYTMIRDMVDPYDYPVAFGAPIGHGGRSMPIVLNIPHTLEVNPEGTVLTFEVAEK